jgi:hypothetical protein
VHQHDRPHVVDVVVVDALVGTHALDRLERVRARRFRGEFAGFFQPDVVVEDAEGHFHLGLQRRLAGLVEIQVLHARGDDGQGDDADRDQAGEQIEFVPDRQVGEAAGQVHGELGEGGKVESGGAP